MAVSYTHLDVYKRQEEENDGGRTGSHGKENIKKNLGANKGWKTI